jgi:hypothetical protein
MNNGDIMSHGNAISQQESIVETGAYITFTNVSTEARALSAIPIIY